MTNLTEERAKARAKTLRGALAAMGHEVAHGQALDLIAKLEGVADWNALSARLGAAIGPLPRGWQRAGDTPHHYDMGVEEHGGTRAAVIRLKPELTEGPGFGTLMQTVEAEAYRGRHVALSARLACRDVEGGVTIWLRADAAGRRSVAFDNLEYLPDPDGPLTGTRDWVERRIVLAIPEEAESLSFGFYLRGTGAAWCDRMALEETEDAVTGLAPGRAAAPVNMAFEG